MRREKKVKRSSMNNNNNNIGNRNRHEGQNAMSASDANDASLSSMQKINITSQRCVYDDGDDENNGGDSRDVDVNMKRTTSENHKRRKNRNIILATGSMHPYDDHDNEDVSSNDGNGNDDEAVEENTMTVTESNTGEARTMTTTTTDGDGSGFITSVKQRGSSRQIRNSNVATLERRQSFEISLREVQNMNDLYRFSFENMLAWEYDVEDFNPYDFIANLPAKEMLPKEDIERPICLPKKNNKDPRITLILDLDETLVHSSSDPIPDADFIFPVLFRGVVYQVYVKKRPYLEEFLKFVSQLFEVVVFTASERAYADKLLDIVDEKKQWIKHRAFRDSCVYVDGNFLKDLTVLDRDLAELAIIDNSPQVFGYHIQNGIPIVSWFDDENDRELHNIMPFLLQLAQARDVRPLIRDKFQFHKILDRYRRR